MYISVVEIDLPDNLDREVLTEGFLTSGLRYTDLPGLLRKYYTLKDDVITGGVFVWESNEHARAGHSDPGWIQLIWDKYGAKPRVSYYEVPVVVDNVMGEICRGSEYLEAMGRVSDVHESRSKLEK